MPCGDVDEMLELHLDADEQLVSFTLQKGSCGAPVGGLLLEPYVRGRRPEQLIDAGISRLVADLEQRRPSERFLLQKQLEALRVACEAYTGRQAAGRDEPFAVLSVDHDPDETVIRGIVRVDLNTGEIPACKGCHAPPREVPPGTSHDPS